MQIITITSYNVNFMVSHFMYRNRSDLFRGHSSGSMIIPDSVSDSTHFLGDPFS